MTPKEFFDFAKQNNAEMVDLKFCDLLGTWQRCSYPIDTLDEGTLRDGAGSEGNDVALDLLVVDVEPDGAGGAPQTEDSEGHVGLPAAGDGVVRAAELHLVSHLVLQDQSDRAFGCQG